MRITRRTFCSSSVPALAASSLRPLAAFAGPADVPALTGSGRQVRLARSDVDDLRRRLRGRLMLAGDAGYDVARRIWNGAFDRHPALIARCAGSTDVIQALDFASRHELLVAVRAGGHSFSGQSVCEGGLMIDLSAMKGTRVDPVAKTARVEAGVLLGDFDREAQAFSLATTAGTVSHTGVAGLTLGGGFGRLCRKLGLACDNLLSVEIVTPDGHLRRASANENPELFWGVRGGGGNFGVVTSFDFQLHTIGPVLLGGGLLFPFQGARDLLRFFADFALQAPDELNTDLVLLTLPDGGRAISVDVCFSGPVSAGERALQPLRARKPAHDGVRPTPYVRLQNKDDHEYPHGRSYYIKSGFLKRMEPGLIDEIVTRFEGSVPSGSIVVFVHHGGAVKRVPDDATAFHHRQPAHSIIIEASWDDRSEAETKTDWVRSTFRAVEAFTEGFYVNELAPDETERRIRASYGSNYERLARLKTQYDPANLLRMNANVKPLDAQRRN